MSDLGAFLQEKHAANDRRDRESRIARGEPFEDPWDTYIELAKRDKEEAALRAEQQAKLQQEQEAEELKAFEMEMKARHHQETYDELCQRIEQITWAARLSDPSLPSGQRAMELVSAELQTMPEISVASVQEAYKRCFDKGLLRPDYSKAARERVIKEAETWRQNGHNIPHDLDTPVEELTPEQSMSRMRRLTPVSVETIQRLEDRLADYEQVKQQRQKKHQPITGRDGSLVRRANARLDQ